MAKVATWFKTGGRIYYSKEKERKVFFYLTIAILIAGILTKFNVF